MTAPLPAAEPVEGVPASARWPLAERWELAVHLGAHPIVYPFLRGIARRGPVVRVPRIGVVVSEAAIARDVITDVHRFSKSAPGSAADWWTPVLGPGVILNMSGDEHAQLRRRLASLFTPGFVRQVCATRLTGPLAAARAELVAGRELDVVRLAKRCAGAVISSLVGMPHDSDTFEDLYGRTTQLTSMVKLNRRSLSPRQVVRARAALDEITAPTAHAYRTGGEETVAGRMRSAGLDQDQARSLAAALVLTGTETVASFVPRLIALAIDTGWLIRLGEDRQLSDAVVNEALRYTVPSPVMLRGVIAETEIDGVAVHPGDRVVISTISCARALGGFQPERPHPAALRQLWFGAGQHFCLGMPLATAEIMSVLDMVLSAQDEAGPLRVTGRRVGRHRVIPGYERLTVRA